MTEIINKNNDFINLYNKSCRLAMAIFAVFNNVTNEEEFRTKVKKMSLELVSMSVCLKDISLMEAKKLVGDIERNSLLLMSMLDIAGTTGMISTMNGNIIKTEFQSFILEIKKFIERFNQDKDVSMGDIFIEKDTYPNPKELTNDYALKLDNNLDFKKINSNGHKRKDTRKAMILDFIKGHSNASIKDIVPNIIGCSEKTVQRELIDLISEGKILKIGERRWSRYSFK